MIRTAPSECVVVECSEWLSIVNNASAVRGQVQCAAKCSGEISIDGGQCREDKFSEVTESHNLIVVQLVVASGFEPNYFSHKLFNKGTPISFY